MIDLPRLKRLLAQIPAKPGVYQMRDETGKIIYVGKSRRLRNRVRSYFSGKRKDLKTSFLTAAAHDIEFIVTGTEVEALILENNLIKRHKPRYNVRLKDSKTHPYLKVTLADPFPRLVKVRKVVFNDGNRYFGPFPDEGGLKRIIALLSRTFRLCTGKNPVDPGRKGQRACLQYHLHLCQGVCIGATDADTYRRSVEKAVDFLSGKETPDLPAMRRTMDDLACAFRFEEAAELRDTIQAWERFTVTQKVEFLKPIDSDFWGLAETPDRLVLSVFFVRSGKLLGNRTIDSERVPGATTATLLGTLMAQFYDHNLIPSRILCSQAPQPLSTLKEFLTRFRGKCPRLGAPRRGTFKRLLDMANENALEILRNLKTGEETRLAEAVIDLERRLGLAAPPRRIECIDISHFQGCDPVASLVVSLNGEPRRGEYRLFHIREIAGIDDPASIAEVTRRRFSRRLREGDPLCDLLLVDGGITQARAARAELDMLGVALPVWGLAKREETLVPPEGEPVRIPVTTPAMRMLTRLRDEAHRFANSFRKKLQSKRMTRSALLNLPGVGPQTLRKILATFGSLAKATAASPEELASRAGIPQRIAHLVHRSLATRAGED